MEYPSKNDFYFKLKVINDKAGNFIDYMVMYISDNFYKCTNISDKLILGKKISEILVDNDNILGLKEYYLNMIPKSRSKHSLYIKELKRWYFINIFSDKSDKEELLIVFYNDVTDIRKNSKQQQLIQPNSNINNIYYLKDRAIFYYRDKLTGLYNKGFIDEEISRLDTKRQFPISLIMGDINGLKLINDAFGHNMGDKVLKKASEIMINSFRKEDIISRVGGDEFVILLPKTSGETALSIVNRINDNEKNSLDFIKISISFGVATKEMECENIHDVLKKAEERMYFKKLKESKAAKQTMIKFLKSRLEKITFETQDHCERLKKLCLMMASELGLLDIEKEELKLLCEFHDIGKIGISKTILQKEGILNKKEWENVKRHSEIGYNIVKEFRDTVVIDELILNHHERWDGKGYPGLLKGEEIPLVVRIFAIADAYDAMVNSRPYKDLMSNRQALKEIEDEAGSQFDPAIAKIFIRLMEKKEQIV